MESDRHIAPASRPVEDIPLRTRQSRSENEEIESDDSEADLDPESGAALLRKQRNRDRELETHANDYRLSLGDKAPRSLFDRVLAFMSRAPLLIRSSPAQGTGSYGAVPITHLDTDSDDDVLDDVRRRDKRKDNGKATARNGRHGSSASRSTAGLQKSKSASRSRRLRRSSSNTSDIGMGPESKSTFATGSVVPGRYFIDGVSSSPGGSTSDEEAIDADDSDSNGNEDDPPDNSPYPQVRAFVSATDNTTFSISTPRMWTLSMVFALAGSATNLFFSLRYPSVAITPIIALVLVHPLGKAWDILLKRSGDPQEVFANGVLQKTAPASSGMVPSVYSKKQKFRLWLAQGRWNEKEHACVYISSNVSFGFAFATDVCDLCLHPG